MQVSLASRVPGGNLGAVLEIQTSQTDCVSITKVGMSLFSANSNIAAVFGIGRPAAMGVIKVNPVVPVTDDGGNNSLSPSIKFGYEWTLAPTIPTNFLRRVNIRVVNTVGTIPVVFKFPLGLRISQFSSLVIWLISFGVASPLSLSFMEPWLEIDG